MFKKRRFRRRPFRRGPPLARKRRTWVESLLIDPCNPLDIPLCQPDDGCCTTRWNMVVLDNQVLQDQFSDRAAVRRILCNLNLGWDIGIASMPNPDDQYAALSVAIGSMYVQLLVRPVDATGQAQLPPDIWNSTSVINGYSEAKAKKTWWHHWTPINGYRQQATSTSFDPMTLSGWKPVFRDCATGLVNQCITRTALTGGDGFTWDYTVPGGIRLDADCEPCGTITPSALTGGGELAYPHAWNFTFDLRKRISLREDEQLILDFQFRSPYKLAQPTAQSSILVPGGGIKTLLEF